MYGLKYSIHPLLVNKTDILATFDFIFRIMTKDLNKEKERGQFEAKLLNLVNTYVTNYRLSNHTMKEHRILERLCKNSNTVTLQPDSGKGTVIMDRDVYIRKNI